MVIISPCFNAALELSYGILIASFETTAEELISKFSKASMAVKTFVVLAGYIFSFAFIPNNVFPLSLSTIIADLQYRFGISTAKIFDIQSIKNNNTASDLIVIFLPILKSPHKQNNYTINRFKNKGVINIINIKETFKNKILKKENKKYVLIIIILAMGIIILVFFNYFNSKNKGLIINGIYMLEELQKEKIGVYIDGEVNKPGYIQIPNGSTLKYAINKAGGITINADIQNIDENMILKNQEKIIIPKIIENNIDEGEETSLDDNENDKININTASVDELTELQGIGEKTAEKIIEYRRQNKFNNIEEIMEVKGIGESKFENIKDKIAI